MRILLIAPFYDADTAGESWSTFKWVEGICQRHEVTVLTTHKKSWDPQKSAVAAKEIVNWTDPSLPTAFARLNRELKPTYVLFYFRARKWIKRAIRDGRAFDLVHQINPLALRYPCPARGCGIPYLMGPLAGSLSNPNGFRTAAKDKQWYRKLRNLDAWRIKKDPWLRQTYSEAHTILGVAPYVAEVLKPAKIQNFVVASETGIESIDCTPKAAPSEGEPLKLLFVGRIIRTKGVIDAIRAVASARSEANITFDIVGTGDMDDECKQEAKSLGVEDIVTFHGRVPREQVNDWYQKSHVFLFASFREPSGNVVFEALGQGVPIITSTQGGPGYVVTDECGFRIKPENPEQYARDLALAIKQVYRRRNELPTLSQAAIQRMKTYALWDKKHEQLEEIYQSVTPVPEP